MDTEIRLFIVLIVFVYGLGVAGYWTALAKYWPEYRDDNRLNYNPFHYTIIGSTTALCAATGMSFIDFIDKLNNLAYTVIVGGTGLFMFATWVWGWIILADSTTVSVISELYYYIYVITIFYQSAVTLYIICASILTYLLAVSLQHAL